MSEQVKRIRVFVASPGDVIKERESLKSVVHELNTTIAPYKGLVLELVKWETHATPDMGRAQGVINSQIGKYDIFIGLMWKRFGTPTGKAESGTEEEFRLAYDEWKNTKSIRILFYFCQAPFMPRTMAETLQIQKVIEFHEELLSLGLTWEYSDSNEFPNVVRPHLARILLDTTSVSPEFDRQISIHVTDKVSITDKVDATVVREKPRVFISSAAEDLPLVIELADFLQELGLEPIRWDKGFFSSGRTIIEAFESTLSDVDAAVIILDQPNKGTPYRQNLIFELGLLQGMLGRAKTIVLSPENAELPSDLLGTIYLRFSKESLKLIKNHLKREFKHMGLLSN